MSDYRGRMMNVRGKSASMMAGDVEKYAEGHRDARRACAEIASGADKEIERLHRIVSDLCAELDIVGGSGWRDETDELLMRVKTEGQA